MNTSTDCSTVSDEYKYGHNAGHNTIDGQSVGLSARLNTTFLSSSRRFDMTKEVDNIDTWNIQFAAETTNTAIRGVILLYADSQLPNINIHRSAIMSHA